jgi:GDP-4-dehydro-6-deoxy-D-mannose reductase
VAPSQRMRILITGANGFVGRHLIDALNALPIAPHIIAATHGENTALAAARIASLDVTDAGQTLALIRAEQPTHLMHLAGIASVSNASHDVRKTWEVNAQGTLNVALSIQQVAPECRLLFCSSAQVYGRSFQPGRPLAEDAQLNPVNIYASSKAAADILIGQLAGEGLRAIRLRPFNHIGPGQSSEFVVSSFASQIAAIEGNAREPIIRVGNLSMRRDFLDVHDVVDAYVQAILRFDSLPNGAVFNIASGEAIAVETILKMLLSMASRIISVVPDPERMRPHDIGVMIGNADAARRALPWQPLRRIEDSLQSVLDYFRRM